MIPSPAVSLLVLAAGRGERLALGTPKAFVELAGKPLLRWSAEALVRAVPGAELVVVAPLEDIERAADIVAGLGAPLRVIPGGKRRQESSLRGLRAATGEYVLIHDAARPLVSRGLVQRVLRAAIAHGAAVPVVPVRDTLRYVREGSLLPTGPERAGLHAVQTPQGFRRELITAALEEAVREGLSLPDDAGALLLRGERVAAVPGEARNLKITYPEDLELALAFLTMARSSPSTSSTNASKRR